LGIGVASESHVGENGQFGIVVDLTGIVQMNGAQVRHCGGGGGTHGFHVARGISDTMILGGGGGECISFDRNGTAPQLGTFNFADSNWLRAMPNFRNRLQI